MPFCSIGLSPSGKATGFDPVMRRFESCHPSHLSPASSESNADTEKDTVVSKLMIFAGNANPELAQDIAKKLHIPMGQATVGRFSDGETTVEINENVRGHDVFIIQPTCYPTNDNLMELIVMADALRRASATLPYALKFAPFPARAVCKMFSAGPFVQRGGAPPNIEIETKRAAGAT